MDGTGGMKARGLCIEPLLQHGIPASEVSDAIIREIDDTLTHNNRQLENCVRELMEMCGEMTNRQDFTNPMEAVEHLIESRYLDKATCYDPDPNAIAAVLKNVQRQLDSKPGCEEALLQQVLELSSLQGLTLPLTSISAQVPTSAGGGGTINSSVASIGAVPDKGEEDNDVLWNDICQRFRRFFCKRLTQIPVGTPSPCIDLHASHRLQYIQSLCVLFPVENIWNKYYNIRSQQFETLFPPKPSATRSKDKMTFCKLVSQLEHVSSEMVVMIKEDFELLNSGVFSDAIPMFRALHEIYLDRFSDELSPVAVALQQALPNICANANKRDLPKSTSESSRIGQLRAPLRKQLSRSLDSVQKEADESSSGGSGLMPEPGTQLEGLVRLINCILGVDNYMDTLHNAMIWEVTHTTKKHTPKGVLKPVSPDPSVATSAYYDGGRRDSTSSMKKPFSPRSFEESGLLPDAIPAPFGSTECLRVSSVKVIEQGTHGNRPPWDWQLAFRKLTSDIASVVELQLRTATERTQSTLQHHLVEMRRIEVIPLPSALVGGRLDYPKVVSKAIWELVNEMEWLLPLATAGNSGPLDIVRSAYVDTVSLSLKDISITLSKVASEVSEKKLPVSTLYALLSTAACVRNHLLHFDNILGADEVVNASKKRFATPYRLFCDCVDGLARQLIEYYTHMIVTSVLHDPESHDWENDKEFFEGERCSFSVQMWMYHMTGLQHDLWATCPPKLAQSVLTAVLSDTLQGFVQRYTHAKPSYKRSKQMRCDITTILLCTSEFLYPVCGSVTRYLDASLAHAATLSIHTLCSSLLAILAVVTSPIDALYKVYKKGFSRKRRNEEDPVDGYPSQWLAFIRSGIFPVGKTVYADLQTTAALYVQVRLLSSQPEVSWPMLLQSLLMKEYTLAIMLLTRTAEQTIASKDATTISQATDLYQAFLDVLVKCGDFPAALTRVLGPLIDRTDEWDLFDTETVIGKSTPTPPWMQAIFTILNKFVIRLVDPAIRVIFENETEKIVPDNLFGKVEELPCSCELKEQNGEEDPTQKDVLGAAMFSLVTQLVEDVYTLPTPLCILFNTLQAVMEDREISSPHDCVGLKIVASCIRVVLSDVEHIEKLTRQTFSEHTRDSFKMLAECVYHVLTSESQNLGIPRIAGIFMKSNRNWLMEQVEILTDHFNSTAFRLTELPPFSTAPTEFLENLLITSASFILHTDTGPKSLQKVYNFVLNNTDWILAQLDIPPLIGGEEMANKAPPEFSLNVVPRSAAVFKPLHAFSHIGDCTLDQAVVREWPYDWTELLQADLGLTEINFRMLLYNRHEMQDGAYLEEIEMKPVSGLHAKFNVENADM